MNYVLITPGRSLRADNPQRRKPDITLAKEHLGWQPRLPLSEGLQRTVEYFDAVLRDAPQRRAGR